MQGPTRIAAALLLSVLAFAATARSQTTVELNTGFNHASYAPYPMVTTPTSTTSDNYWITVASYPPLTPSTPTPAWVERLPGAWSQPFANTSWIGPRNTTTSAPGTSPTHPSYALFRKCFCLLRNFRNARLDLSVRADDTVQIWLNTQLNQVVPAQPGAANTATPVSGSTQNPSHFVTGRNCLYVLVEDRQPTLTGFDLTGKVSASGLLPLPATGPSQTFEPCICPQPTGASTDRAADVGDQQVIAEILKIAEARRTAGAAKN